jgi:hypothetical protein
MKLKKALKAASFAVAGILLFVLLAVLLSPLWLGPAVKTTANCAVPGMAGVGFKLEECDIGTFSGKILLSGMTLENPEGFSDRVAASFESLKVDIDMASLAGDVIHIREIALSGLYVSYLDGPHGTNNFKVISGNFASGKGDGCAECADCGEEPAPAAENAAADANPPADAGKAETDGAKQKRVVIDVVRIEGTRIKFGILPPISVPSIVIRDIGKESGGAGLQEAWKSLCDSLMKSCGMVGDGISALGKASLKLGKIGIESGTNALNRASGAFKELGESGSEGVKTGVNGLVDMFKRK